MPDARPPMRAVVMAASTMNPDAEGKVQQLAWQTGMGADLVRHNPQAAQQRAVAQDLDQRDLEITNPILARQLQDPNFAEGEFLFRVSASGGPAAKPAPDQGAAKPRRAPSASLDGAPPRPPAAVGGGF